MTVNPFLISFDLFLKNVSLVSALWKKWEAADMWFSFCTCVSWHCMN
jgi:hypothetical protein